ncbi:YgjP family zinc-dependent metalloprotease [Xanthomonas hortorum]|uniref:YgjP-like metallopeptidase domain-containing protein n=3 Tax=Xanthomonas hortorum TaxID=56454 RepID=A0A6V7CE90_9XANT|nr:SprT family zinc-dependent metalloprotease [Xanthomonas hortorum]APP81508.1 metal-dependent hydrolase [Xanthomonas hortorum pv. gardneri]EGD20988.1 putative metal-dependent hydrolase [Xanthomonas hortorum ATCC 19865]KLA93745.1 metal-dependent hydrolase [Xanthomonas hortorum pv. gardneri]KLA97981.1 metal-dependent hydrolase [Xanthomonas hortorum pv. gardneri]KLB00199.1 metal-dependent hydrolase [Xanthomonas hortorum pv. gardneri]
MTPIQTNAEMVVTYGERRIHCQIQRSALRRSQRVAIHVEPDGRVRLDAPLQATDAQIKRALIQRARWIHLHLMEIEQRLRHVTPREYVSGETVLYLGRRYRLKVILGDQIQGVRLRGGYVEARVPSRAPEVVRAALEGWQRERARLLLPQRVADVAAQLRWIKQVPPLSLRVMQRQWGSCSPLGRISLNLGLIRVPGACIDYVILHELCHLKVHNHGKGFYRLLDAHLPGWRGIKQRLDGLAELALRH